MRKALVLIPLMILSACGPKIDLGRAPPPAERLVCAPLPKAPQVSALQAFSVGGVMAYRKEDVDARDKLVAGWLVDIHGAWFSCSNTVGWHKDYWAE